MNIIKLILLLLVLMAILVSCSEDVPVSPKPLEYCPPPYDTLGYGGGEMPTVAIHYKQKVSHDGEKLAIIFDDVALRVLYLKTGKVQNIDFREKLPPHIRYISVSKAIWCPYNSNKLLAFILTQTDTVGDGKKYVWGANIYIVHLKENQIERITPDFVGKAGFYPTNFGIAGWLPESIDDKDYIALTWSNEHGQSSGLKIYIPQTGEISDFSGDCHPAQKYGKYCIKLVRNGLTNIGYDIDGHLLTLIDFQKTTIFYRSFSPDGKKLALSVQLSAVEDGKNIPYYLRRFSEIWIIDVEKFLRNKPDTAIYPDKIISYRKAFCMYNYEAGHAEYITNDRLAVSMFHTVYDGYGFLYEITEDGRMVRQLTFEP